MAKCVLLLLAFICAVRANMKPVPPNPDFPNQCWDGKNKTYNIGKYYPLLHTSCKQMWCREDFILIKEDCGIVEVPTGYKNVQDLTKRFPDCCVKLIKIDDTEKEKEKS